MILRSKYVFLLLCIVLTILASHLATLDWIMTIFESGISRSGWIDPNKMDGFIVDLQSLIREFLVYSFVVLGIWILTARFHIKNWLHAGLAGSAIYSALLLLFQHIIAAEYSYDSLWKGAVLVLEGCLAAGLAALPQWFVLRKAIPTAYKWLIANSTGYGILYFLGWFRLFAFKQWVLRPPGRDNPILYQTLQHWGGHQPTREAVLGVGFGLLGALLGLALLDLFKNDKPANLVSSPLSRSNPE